MTLSESIESNEVTCAVLRKDGTFDRIQEGKIQGKDRIPQKGDKYRVGGLGCTVIGHAYTPNLPSTWYLFLQEN